MKDIVTFSHYRVKATLALDEPQQNPLKLIQGVPTRWNPIYFMIGRFFLLPEPGSHALCQIDSDEDIIPNSSLKALTEV